MAEETPDMAELAKKILDLWQDHLSAMANDPNTARDWNRFASLWKQYNQGASHDLLSAFFSFTNDAASRPPGTTSSSSSSGVSDASLEQRRHDLAAIEERLARLEAKLAERTARHRSKTQKPTRRKKTD